MGLTTAVPATDGSGTRRRGPDAPHAGGPRGRAARALPGLAVASLVANIVIIATGGAVRLTASGLGCPTWPECGGGSYVAHSELGIHGAVEFGNRLLTVVLVAVVAATVAAAVAARRIRPGTLGPAVLLLAGIPVQAVIGGITVLTKLNPWVVMVHFVASSLLVAVGTVLVLRTRPRAVPGPRAWAVARPLRGLARLVGLVVAGVVYLGTIVTGSGPHAGDLAARRTGLDPAAVGQLHADLVMLLLGLTVGLVVAVRTLPPEHRPAGAARAAGSLLGVEAGQSLVGAVQYATGLPVGLVDLHLVGAAGVVATAVWAVTALRAPVRGRPAGQLTPETRAAQTT